MVTSRAISSWRLFLNRELFGWVVILQILAAAAAELGSSHTPPGSSGHELCRCLTTLEEIPLRDPGRMNASSDVWIQENLGETFNASTYGLGCARHDANTPMCDPADCAASANVFPPRTDCDLSWCQRSFCWVDPTECKLLHRRSRYFPRSNRFYSYATCGEADSFTNTNRFASLEGKVLRVGMNSNTGGWLGAYSSEKRHFQGPMSLWSGPVVDFVTEAASTGNFFLNITAPPERLRNRSEMFFGGQESPFSECVFATSLGYLDLCVAQYTVTDARATSTDWLLLGSSGIYLVALSNPESSRSSWDTFTDSVSTIFVPFTTSTWVFIVLFVIPVLGTLMVVHERGVSGSSYPMEEVVLNVDKEGNHSSVSTKRVSLARSIARSVYVALLASLEQMYEQSVVTAGAMFNLLGISFFILTIVAVYTANLAAILTQKTEVTAISNLDEAIRSGLRFCSERRNMESILAVRSDVDASMFVDDPIELGGDGVAGFNCANCASRTRVFDFIDPGRAESDARYCHAALAPSEDLEVLRSQSQHCNKTLVGTPIHFAQTGIPIFEAVSVELTSFFLKLKNDGVFDKHVVMSRPSSRCPVIQGGEGSSLSLSQLSGIWVVSFGFALAGLLVTFGKRIWRNNFVSHNGTAQPVYIRDQRGFRIDALEKPISSDQARDHSLGHHVDPTNAATHNGLKTPPSLAMLLAENGVECTHMGPQASELFSPLET